MKKWDVRCHMVCWFCLHSHFPPWMCRCVNMQCAFIVTRLSFFATLTSVYRNLNWKCTFCVFCLFFASLDVGDVEILRIKRQHICNMPILDSQQRENERKEWKEFMKNAFIWFPQILIKFNIRQLFNNAISFITCLPLFRFFRSNQSNRIPRWFFSFFPIPFDSFVSTWISCTIVKTFRFLYNVFSNVSIIICLPYTAQNRDWRTKQFDIAKSLLNLAVYWILVQ